MSNSFKATIKNLVPGRLWNAVRIFRYPEFLPNIAGGGNYSYDQDGLATILNADFRTDRKFLEAYKQGEQTNSWKGLAVHWRVHVLLWAAMRGMELEGDFVECGVNRGGYAVSLMHYLNFKDKKFYLFDTFKGLVESQVSEEESDIYATYKDYYEDCFEDVQKTFKNFDNAVLVRGTVPESLSTVSIDKVAFISIDMNCVAPEIAAAEYFWDKMTSGAMMVLDDYGWPSHHHQKVAFDKFAKERDIYILSLPTGQGVLLKP